MPDLGFSVTQSDDRFRFQKFAGLVKVSPDVGRRVIAEIKEKSDSFSIYQPPRAGQTLSDAKCGSKPAGMR